MSNMEMNQVVELWGQSLRKVKVAASRTSRLGQHVPSGFVLTATWLDMASWFGQMQGADTHRDRSCLSVKGVVSPIT